MKQVNVSELKMRVAALTEDVRSTREPLLITKGRIPMPVAILFPVNHDCEPVDSDGRVLRASESGDRGSKP